MDSYDVLTTSIAVGSLAVYYIIMLALIVLMIVAQWKIFTKAGKPGWQVSFLFTTPTAYLTLRGETAGYSCSPLFPVSVLSSSILHSLSWERHSVRAQASVSDLFY